MYRGRDEPREHARGGTASAGGREGTSRASWVVAGLGLLVCALYVSYTGPATRNPDGLSHLEYAKFVLEHATAPESQECTICHHPPLYYGLAAIALRVGQWLGLDDPARAAQALSWLLTAVLVGFSVGTFGLLLARRWQRTIATALVAFWPYTIIQSARVNPDVAVNALAAVALYGAARWWVERRPRWLAIAGSVALLACGCKASGLVLVAAVLCVVGVGVALGPERRSSARSVAPIATLMIAGVTLLSLARGDPGDGLVRGVLGTAYKSSAPIVEQRSVRAYLRFDVQDFLARPYARADMTRSREPSFWNHWLKSSLFGTRPALRPGRASARPPNDGYAQGLLGMLLASLSFAALAAVRSWRSAGPTKWFVLATLIPYWIAAVAFHALVPAGHHADFRMTFPILVPAALGFALAAGALRERRSVLWHASYVLACEWTALSVAYFVPGLEAAAHRAKPAVSATPPAAAEGSAERSSPPTRPTRRPPGMGGLRRSPKGP